MQTLIKTIGPAFLEKKLKSEKSNRQIDRQMNNGQSEKLTWAFSSGEITIIFFFYNSPKWEDIVPVMQMILQITDWKGIRSSYIASEQHL
jgi:hypothetical protein